MQEIPKDAGRIDRARVARAEEADHSLGVLVRGVAMERDRAGEVRKEEGEPGGVAVGVHRKAEADEGVASDLARVELVDLVPCFLEVAAIEVFRLGEIVLVVDVEVGVNDSLEQIGTEEGQDDT